MSDREDPPEALEERLIASELLHRGRYLDFRIDTLERPDGRRVRREVAGHPGAVAVVALDDEGRLLLVRQWRSPAGSALLEIPAGTLERDGVDGKTEDPDLAAAARTRGGDRVPGRAAGNGWPTSGPRPASRPS